jgi:hypothetical protein
MTPQADRIATAGTRTFEIRRRSGDRWVLDSVADDKQIAINLANSLLKGGHASLGVQVVAVLEAGDGQFKEISVYRATPEDQRASEAGRSRVQIEARRKVKIERAPQELRRESPPRAPGVAPRPRARAPHGLFRGVTWRTWVTLGVLVVWCSFFYLWRQPQTPWAFDATAAQSSSPQPNTLESRFRTIFPQR